MNVLAVGDRDPSFLTHREVDAALRLMPADCECSWTATDSAAARELGAVDAVWLLPGTPYRDDAAAYAAVGHCLDTGTPFLGTCGGFQYACVELARRLTDVARAAHAETEPDAADPVIAPLACALHGELSEVRPVRGTTLARICGTKAFAGFHYCGYGLVRGFAERLERAGVVISALGDDDRTEAIEMPEHPFFLATAFQPQVGSSRRRELHPVLDAMLDAARRFERSRPHPANEADAG